MSDRPKSEPDPVLLALRPNLPIVASGMLGSARPADVRPLAAGPVHAKTAATEVQR